MKNQPFFLVGWCVDESFRKIDRRDRIPFIQHHGTRNISTNLCAAAACSGNYLIQNEEKRADQIFVPILADGCAGEPAA